MSIRFFLPRNSVARCAAAAAVFGLLIVPTLRAVEFPNGDRNTTDPGIVFNNQFFKERVPWRNVGQTDKGSAIYLGDIGGNGKQWVLTVHHATNNGTQPATVTIEDIPYKTVPGTMVWLVNSDGKTPVDLVLMQVSNAPPRLPALKLQTAPLTKSDGIYYIGYGGNTKRWGFNNYERSEFHVGGPDGDGVCLISDFTLDSTNANEAQAINGDSGGAAFFYDTKESAWKLAGVIFDISGNKGQPGQLTYSLSMAEYGEKILAATK